MRAATAALLLLALAVPAAADPSVSVVRSDCTTEPAPRAPIVRARHGKGVIRVHVVGAGHLCAAGWTLRTTSRVLTLKPDASVDAPACPSTCAIDLVVRGLPGRWNVRVE